MPPLTDEELAEEYRGTRGSNKPGDCINLLFQRYHTKIAVWCFRITG